MYDKSYYGVDLVADGPQVEPVNSTTDWAGWFQGVAGSYINASIAAKYAQPAAQQPAQQVNYLSGGKSHELLFVGLGVGALLLLVVMKE